MVGFAACCNGQKQVDTVGWSASTDWVYNNKLASKDKQQLKRCTTCKFVAGIHINARRGAHNKRGAKF